MPSGNQPKFPSEILYINVKDHVDIDYLISDLHYITNI